MEDYTIIEDDEDIIGKVLDIKKCFINILIQDLKNKDIDLESKIYQINLTQDLLDKLKDEYDDTIIKVSFNPMGAYYFKNLTWEE